MSTPQGDALPVPPAGDRGARLRTRALLPGVLGGVLALVAGAQPWWRATGEGIAVDFSGTETTAGLSQALGFVGLAGWLLVLTLRARGRQVVAAVLTLTGAGAMAVGLLGLRPSAAAVRAQVREVSLADQFGLGPTGWSYGYAAAGLLVMVGGVLVLVTAPRWPRRPDRFARQAPVLAATTPSDDPAEVWRAQDAGLDPTLAPERSDADVTERSDAEVMERSDAQFMERSDAQFTERSDTPVSRSDNAESTTAPASDVHKRAPRDTMGSAEAPAAPPSPPSE